MTVAIVFSASAIVVTVAMETGPRGPVTVCGVTERMPVTAVAMETGPRGPVTAKRS